MKFITIMQDVEMEGVPGLRKGAEVRINDEKADMLIERGLAKEVKGKSRDEVEKELKKEVKKEVTVTKK